MALTLLRKGKTVCVIDKPALSSSSKIAAGVYNPFNFRQLMNNWRAKEMVAAARSLYGYTEEISTQKIFTERIILKIFTSAEERKLWENACIEKQGLLASEEISEDNFNGSILAPHGTGKVSDGGSIDCGMFLYVVTEELKNRRAFCDEKFDPEKLEINGSENIYDEKVSAKHIIFCEGHLVTSNPWFNYLPIKPAKGQLLHVYIPGLSMTEVINRGAYLLPLGQERFVLGSTFDNDAVDELITETAREDLLARARKFVIGNIRVESQFAGIRPAVQDRRPVVGKHPAHPQLSLLNGMGSKAVLLSPWLAEKLLEHIEQDVALPAEVDIGRFKASD